MKTGVEIIADERARQIEIEGWSAEHDAQYDGQQLAMAAMCYACPSLGRMFKMNEIGGKAPDCWPWDPVWWKPAPGDRIRELAKAGALIAAEIDRIQNINTKQCRS